MTAPEQKKPEQTRAVSTIRTGGHVAAVVPQSISEIWHVAKGVVASGLAPKSLGKGQDQVSAVAITIMAGMELGLKPMVALRSFTVINGRPALYGDGLIAVVRMSGKAKSVRTGCFADQNGNLVGWCEAERADTGESSRVEFTQEDAVRAGLWQDQPFIDKEVWENRQKVIKKNQPNDSPWYRYPKRMLAWRAAGYCLRELFGDVLGGIRDEYEEREIAEAHFEEMQIASNEPPPPPDEENATDVEPFDAAAFATEIIEQIGKADDEAALVLFWEERRVDAMLEDHPSLLDECYEARNARLAMFEDTPEPEAPPTEDDDGQGSLIPDED
jgi:hypothetical protein